jgi:type I restriction enzyme S subunit
MPVKTLGDVTERIFIPPRFKRIYVEANHGVPFLQGSHIIHFQPADLKYLSRAAHRNLDKWIIRQGWILVTCSGTIGRVTIAPPQWDGWAASQHILRIIPKSSDEVPPGYLCAYLASPVGQAQLTAQIYGAVVDELTEGQARGVLIPIPSTPEQRRQMNDLNKLILEAMQLRARAAEMAGQAVAAIDELVPPPSLPPEDEPESEFDRFQKLARSLLAVPKAEVEKVARAEEEAPRRQAHR